MRVPTLRPVVLVLAVALAAGSLPRQALGHGMRLPFDQWGGFSGATARCQREIARAAADCASARWTLLRGCLSAQLAGLPCDQAATMAAIDAARISALDGIDQHCSERQAIDLQYLGSFDLQQDVVNFCRDWPTAARSAVFGPVDAAQPPPAAARACVEAAADATTSAMAFIFRSRRRCMDRAAGMSLEAPNRLALLDSAGRRIDAAYASLAERLAARCPAGTFAALYRRSPSDFLAALGRRADCLGAQVYIQDAVLCPAAVCGNAIVEPGEDCDDGNTVGGDTCPADCISLPN